MYRIYDWISQASYIGSLVRNPRYLLTTSGLFIVLGLAVTLGYYFDNWLLALAIGLGLLFVILLIWLAYLVLSQRESQRRDRGLEEGVDEAVAARRAREAERQALKDLENRFHRSLEELRRSRLGKGGIYDLPWLLVLGERGAGKSAALRESGLDLSSEYARLVGDGPTADCDWWLTNEAVVLDTAGDLLERDDAHGRRLWRTLLRLVRRARPRLPLEGLIVAIPVTSLLGKSPRELEDAARRLRRRFNELKDGLKVDVPIYILVTKADLIEGFVEVASQLPPGKLDEAFGWTNPERRFADAGDVVLDALEEIRARLDRFVPEMVLRESGPERRRKLFLFPQELEDLAESLATLLRRAFAPSVYDETPFLRGIYLVSATRGGRTVSPLLTRLGFEWATGTIGDAGPQRGFFLRDAMRDIVVGDRDLALHTGRIGPLARRFIFGIASLAMVALVVIWSVGFWRDRGGVKRLRADAGSLISAPASLPVLDRLRQTIQGEEQRSAGFFGGFGFRGVFDQALARARRSYVWSFEREFEDPTKANLLGAVRRYDDDSFEALAELALDITWLSSRAGLGPESRPHLYKFAQITRNEADRKSFTDGYDAFVHWATDIQLRTRVERERELLSGAAATLLDLQRLMRWSELNPDTNPPVNYRDVGVPVPSDEIVEGVPGAFTRATWEALVRGLIQGIDRSGGASRAALEQFRRSYVARYDSSWRQYLIDTPLPPRSDPSVKDSPYVALLDQIEHNASAELPRDGDPPPWIVTLEEVRRDKPRELAEGEKPPEKPQEPPWLTYQRLLEQVGADVAASQVNDKAALSVAIKVAKDEPTSFGQALDQIRGLVPASRDAQAADKIRQIMSMPVLDGFSAVLDTAMEAIDTRWADRIANRYAGDLSQSELEELYAPGTGELAKFQKDVMGAFYQDGRPAAVLGDREMFFGPHFLGWLAAADRVQRAMFPGTGQTPEITVRLDGVPSRVVGGGFLVTRRDLVLTCGAKVESFSYREGSGSHAFPWTPACQEVSLRVWVSDAHGPDRELKPRKEWRGPLAFPRFFQDGRGAGGGRYEWTLSYPGESSDVIVTYLLRSGDPILAIAHTPPPPSVRE